MIDTYTQGEYRRYLERWNFNQNTDNMGESSLKQNHKKEPRQNQVQLYSNK